MTTHDMPARPAARPAALPFRLLALIYDLFPVAALCFAVAAVVLLLRGGTPVAPGSLAAALELAAMLAVAFAYFALSWRHGGQTIGMRAWRLRLVRSDGGAPIHPRALVLRWLMAWISLAACGLGFFWSLLDSERRTWQDMASDTVLVRLPRP